MSKDLQDREKEREKEKEDLTSKLWTLHFDGARRKIGSREEICLTFTSGENTLRSFHLQFAYSNNKAEYEGFVHGLSLAEHLGVN